MHSTTTLGSHSPWLNILSNWSSRVNFNWYKFLDHRSCLNLPFLENTIFPWYMESPARVPNKVYPNGLLPIHSWQRCLYHLGGLFHYRDFPNQRGCLGNGSMEEIHSSVEPSDRVLPLAWFPSSASPAGPSGELTSSFESVENHRVQFALTSFSPRRDFETRPYDPKTASSSFTPGRKNQDIDTIYIFLLFMFNIH